MASRPNVERATAAESRKATPATVARAKRWAIIVVLVGISTIAAWIVFVSLNSATNDISNIICDPTKRLSCSYVTTPTINKVGDIMSFFLGAPAFFSVIFIPVFFLRWRDEVKKLTSQ